MAQAGVNVDAAALAALEANVRDFHFRTRQPVHSLLSGRHASRVHGRGLAFEELRPYLPGDDVRTMDWRVTARTGTPHVRVYAEEKERPVLLVVDQRMNMFFGSRRSMKSVSAAEVAALAAWRVLADGDRVGGVVFGDTGQTALPPQRSRHGVLHLLGEVVRYNLALRADAPAQRSALRLNAALESALRLAHHDHLVIVIGDFDGSDSHTRHLMMALRGRNDVLSVLVYDPFLLELPDSGHLVVSNGELQVELGFGNAALRQSIRQFADDHSVALMDWHRAIDVPLLPLSAAEPTDVQLRRLLGRPDVGAIRTRASPSP
ncbi:DUF58 domain-containing protein [Cupriavidus pampae]|uniref:DUF58 domain-containing protein n=1 Tax=Cupriavidus pampae TaxID=659251 RepID=A0ABN7YH30_9BURK|nr:DUF58 domain-containing protein [Cupriavidus pampae]CAG9172727.1 hypothetical protein LMG32289_02663 [Cupriavidus pampae]